MKSWLDTDDEACAQAEAALDRPFYDESQPVGISTPGSMADLLRRFAGRPLVTPRG
jgi:hypothetical protein